MPQYRSWATSDAARKTMQGNRRRDTRPELALRRVLHASGLRYRVDAAPIPGLRRRADILFRGALVAVYVDGCFWHGCEEHYKPPKGENADYWGRKVERNKERDRETDILLQQAGWAVLRVWEHEDVRRSADLVSRTVLARRAAAATGCRLTT